jgi:hypothetical protein
LQQTNPARIVEMRVAIIHIRMEIIQEVLEAVSKSPYKGSLLTCALVAEEIKSRYGEKELENFDPYRTVRTYKNWLEIGYRVKRGEKAIRSFTFLKEKDAQDNVVKCYKKTVCLFYYLQVEKIGSSGICMGKL